jgi:antitoxin component YwqK of YwqJK toxin-antitoxin module
MDQPTISIIAGESVTILGMMSGNEIPAWNDTQGAMATVNYFDNGIDIGPIQASRNYMVVEKIVPVALRRCMALLRVRRPLLARELVTAIILPRIDTICVRYFIDGALMRRTEYVDGQRHGIDRTFRELYTLFREHYTIHTSLLNEREYVMGKRRGLIQHWKPTGERGHRFRWKTRFGRKTLRS